MAVEATLAVSRCRLRSTIVLRDSGLRLCLPARAHGPVRSLPPVQQAMGSHGLMPLPSVGGWLCISTSLQGLASRGVR